MIRAFALIALGVVLAGCGGGEKTSQRAAPARVGAAFVPDATGLAVEGSGLRVDFGRSARGVISVMNRERGAGRDVSLDGCPTGVVRQVAWGDLILNFTPEQFVGWKTETDRAGQSCA